jgi:hypothetical protein
MAQTVKGTIGDQPVELINAATEATLAAMLAIAKQDSAVLRAMAQKANVDAKAIEKASKAMEENSKQAGSAGKGLGDTASKASLLGGFMMDMGQAAVKTMGNLVNFGDELLEGKAKASDLFKAFKDLPLGLGLLAGILEKVMKYQEKNLDIYQQISGTGAGLNGSLAGLRTQASSLYLTMGELVGMYKKNSDVFQQLGGSATSGSKAFLGINQTLQRSFGPQLSNLGYTFTEINDLLGGYLRVTGDGMRVNKDSATEQTRLAAAAANYGKELDYMARLTGESREATEKKMQAEAMEASFQAHLNTLEPKEREKAMMAMNRAMTIGGKGAVDALKAELMGFAAPFSEEGRTFVSMTGQAANAVSGLAKTVKDGSSVEAAKVAQNKLQAAGIAGLIKDMKGFNNIVAAAGQGGAEASKGLMEMQAIVNKYNASGKVNQEQIEKEIAEVLKKTEADSNASAAANASARRMKDLSDQINRALQPVMEKLAIYANELVIKFTDFIKKVDFEKFGKTVTELIDKVVEYTKNFFDPAGRKKVLNDIKTLFQELMIEMKLALNPFYSQNDKQKELARLGRRTALADTTAADEQKKEELADLRAKMEAARFAKANETNLKEEKEKAEATEKALKNKKDLTEDEKKTLEAATAKIKENTDKLAKAMTPDQLKAAKEQEAKLYQESLVTTAERNKAVQDFNANDAKKPKQGYNPQNRTPEQRDTGSYGATGKLIENFGAGTEMELHGKEGVITENQLANLVTGAMNSGNAQAQIALANAVSALNKQQAMTNQLLAQSLDMQRKIAESPSWMGNRFARVA